VNRNVTSFDSVPWIDSNRESPASTLGMSIQSDSVPFSISVTNQIVLHKLFRTKLDLKLRLTMADWRCITFTVLEYSKICKWYSKEQYCNGLLRLDQIYFDYSINDFSVNDHSATVVKTTLLKHYTYICKTTLS